MFNIELVKSFCSLNFRSFKDVTEEISQWDDYHADLLILLKKHTYIDSSKQVKRVCVWETGLLSSFSVFRDINHGFHRKEWRNFLHVGKK